MVQYNSITVLYNQFQLDVTLKPERFAEINQFQTVLNSADDKTKM